MTSSYVHVLERQPAVLPTRLESHGNLDSLQAKKNFSVSHLLDLEEAGDLVAVQADEGVGESGRSLLESPGLTSGSDTQQQDARLVRDPSGADEIRRSPGLGLFCSVEIIGVAVSGSCSAAHLACGMTGKRGLVLKQ
ncbi:hypothetical protein JRQ81_012653 [Phrynocephalus forsythii]|uniref:Uncharacterized protein n=1 Tax=Phrynocephalus forsythii TaxID=171643 RepID=A0A9Q1B5Y5_9SAUR|nr:hypothetical protein JRQ81_012653 [Phrynocephalus forsythii]